MAEADVGELLNVTIKEEAQEVSDVKGCYIWISESDQPEFLEETSATLKPPKGKRIRKKKCAVYGCPNSYCGREIESSGHRLSYHKFPTDEGTRAIWVQLCGRPNKFSEKNSVVCSAHFKSEDYIRYNSIDYEMVKNTNRLVTAAIPSVNLPKSVMPDFDPRSYNGSLISEPRSTPSDDHSVEIIPEVHELIVLSSSDDEDDTKENEDKKCKVQKRLFDVTNSIDGSLEEEKSPKILKLNNGQNIPCSKNFQKVKTIKTETEEIMKPIQEKSNLVTIICSDEEDIVDHKLMLRKEVTKQERPDKDKEYDMYNLKYLQLLKCSRELKSQAKTDIDKLKDVLKNMDEKYNQELREILSVFLKGEEVKSIISQIKW